MAPTRGWLDQTLHRLRTSCCDTSDGDCDTEEEREYYGTGGMRQSEVIPVTFPNTPSYPGSPCKEAFYDDVRLFGQHTGSTGGTSALPPYRHYYENRSEAKAPDWPDPCPASLRTDRPPGSPRRGDADLAVENPPSFSARAKSVDDAARPSELHPSPKSLGKELSERSRDDVSGAVSTSTSRPKRWTDEVLEGFLHSTLVQGAGLVLTKLDSGGGHKRSGERILSYDPKTTELRWRSTGLLHKPGGVFAKDIDEILREETVITIVISANAAGYGSTRRRSLPTRGRQRMSPMAAGKRKTFQTSQERDAHILQEVLLLVQKRARAVLSSAGSNRVLDVGPENVARGRAFW